MRCGELPGAVGPHEFLGSPGVGGGGEVNALPCPWLQWFPLCAWSQFYPLKQSLSVPLHEEKIGVCRFPWGTRTSQVSSLSQVSSGLS